MPNRYDVIVAGVGAMGSAACWQLARRGRKVLGIERFDVPHSRGSSHGFTRIIRLPHWHSPAYVSLVRRAYELWRETETVFGEQLMFITGSLQGGPNGGDGFAETAACCRDEDIDHEILGGAEVGRRFPGLDLPDHFLALYQPEGGFIACERAIVAHVTMAQAAGAEIYAQEQVLEWAPIAGGGVRVITNRGHYEADRLVLANGAWIGDLAPPLKRFATPERQVVAWFQPDDPAIYAPETFPATILFLDEGGYYVLPIWGTPGVKVGLHHHLGERGPVEELSREPTAEDESLLRRCLERHLPRANGPAMALRTCLYTNMPDEDFVIDRMPGQEEVIVVSACSGHGYKFASTIGEIIADLATTGASDFDLTMFRLDRF